MANVLVAKSSLSGAHLNFGTVTQHFIVTELRRLKIGEAVGLDNISSRLLKDAAEIIAEPLTRIINISLTSGTVPIEWKTARVIPPI